MINTKQHSQKTSIFAPIIPFLWPINSLHGRGNLEKLSEKSKDVCFNLFGFLIVLINRLYFSFTKETMKNTFLRYFLHICMRKSCKNKLGVNRYDLQHSTPGKFA